MTTILLISVYEANNYITLMGISILKTLAIVKISDKFKLTDYYYHKQEKYYQSNIKGMHKIYNQIHGLHIIKLCSSYNC